MEDNLRRYGNTYQTEYSLFYLKEIVRANIEDYSECDLDSIENCLQCLADNMICLFFDYEYQDISFFD